jgi:hypothetical protein
VKENYRKGEKRGKGRVARESRNVRTGGQEGKKCDNKRAGRVRRKG